MDLNLFQEVGDDIGVAACNVVVLTGIFIQIEEQRRAMFFPRLTCAICTTRYEVRLVSAPTDRS
jgi:hypothetical protein